MAIGANPAGPGPSEDGPVVLFDDECGLCNRAVRFILKHDEQGRFRFASLRSPIGRELAGAAAVEPGGPDTILLVDGRRVLDRSSAVLEVAARLPSPWRFLSLFRFLPRPARDAVYDFVARHRRAIFGRTTCAIPDPEQRARFLDRE